VHHKNYYGPFVSSGDLYRPLDEERNIPGLRLDIDTQSEFLNNLRFEKELLAIPAFSDDELVYSFSKEMFGPGDAELLYGVIRYLKPRKIIEIGAGASTLIAQQAIRMNKCENASYSCSHICIEPYENPWLAKLEVNLIQKRVEHCPLSLFESLGDGDILFIDSSHTVKPQGDVLYETFDIYGSLRRGVYVHVHDIFTPRDYPSDWILERRRLWHEQYLLEAFLSFNSNFQIVCALNWLWRNHPEMLVHACPILTTRMVNNPGSFWFRRV
jgi:hypothetical protein